MSFSVIIPPPQKLKNPSGITVDECIRTLISHSNKHIVEKTIDAMTYSDRIIYDFFEINRKELLTYGYSYVASDARFLQNLINVLKQKGYTEIDLINLLDSNVRVIGVDGFPWVWSVAVRPLYVTDDLAKFLVDNRFAEKGVFYSRNGWFVKDADDGTQKLGDMSVGSWYIIWFYYYFDPDSRLYRGDVYLMDNWFNIIGSSSGFVYGETTSVIWAFDYNYSDFSIRGSVELDWVVGLGQFSAGPIS